MKLYELAGQFIGLSRLMEDGEMDEQALQDTLDGLTGELEQKAEGLLGYVANIGSDVDSIDTEIKRLQARKKVMTNRQESLRNYLKINMVSAGIQKISCPLFTITLRKPIDVVQLDPGITSGLPDEYKTIKITANRVAIKSALKAGKQIDGCRLVPGQPGLLIK